MFRHHVRYQNHGVISEHQGLDKIVLLLKLHLESTEHNYMSLFKMD